MFDSLAELVSDFWYALIHSVGYALVSNKFLLWLMATFLAIWIAGIVYNERHEGKTNQSSPKQANG